MYVSISLYLCDIFSRFFRTLRGGLCSEKAVAPGAVSEF